MIPTAIAATIKTARRAPRAASSAGSIPKDPGHPGCAVRAGDWKLIRFFEDNHAELYNLKDDLGETRNLAADHPDKVRELNGFLDNFLKQTGAVLPKSNPDYAPAGR